MNIKALIFVAGSSLALAACSTTPEAGISENNAATSTVAQEQTVDAQMMDNDGEVTNGTIVDVAVEAGSFTTLVAALQATGLDEALAGDGPFTVFAPTDAAFAKLPAGTVEGLLEKPEELAKILQYHVVAGKVTSGQVVNLDSATTLLGEDVTITVDGDTVMVNDAEVTTVDVMASNGVIHIIDSVLLPN